MKSGLWIEKKIGHYLYFTISRMKLKKPKRYKSKKPEQYCYCPGLINYFNLFLYIQFMESKQKFFRLEHLHFLKQYHKKSM